MNESATHFILTLSVFVDVTRKKTWARSSEIKRNIFKKQKHNLNILLTDHYITTSSYYFLKSVWTMFEPQNN